MAWVRFDDQYPIHRKVAGLSDAAFRLHSAAIFWCARNGMDGFVPEDDLDQVCAQVRDPARFAAECVRRGAWHDAGHACASDNCPAPRNGRGWAIHDYLEYQPTKDEADAARRKQQEQKSSGGKLGNHRRWHAARGVVEPDCPWCGGDPPSDSDRLPIARTDRLPIPPGPSRPNPKTISRARTVPPCRFLFEMADECFNTSVIAQSDKSKIFHHVNPRELNGGGTMPAICFTCKEPGHIAADCPELDNVDTRPRWCGICDPRTRLVTIELDSGTVKRCPDCNPAPYRTLAQHKRCGGCRMVIHEWDTNPCGEHSSPVNSRDSRLPRKAIDAIVAREMAAEDHSAAVAELRRNDPPEAS